MFWGMPNPSPRGWLPGWYCQGLVHDPPTPPPCDKTTVIADLGSVGIAEFRPPLLCCLQHSAIASTKDHPCTPLKLLKSRSPVNCSEEIIPELLRNFCSRRANLLLRSRFTFHARTGPKMPASFQFHVVMGLTINQSLTQGSRC